MQPHDIVLMAGLAVAALAWLADHLLSLVLGRSRERFPDA
jgi:hypothetical protein